MMKFNFLKPTKPAIIILMVIVGIFFFTGCSITKQVKKPETDNKTKKTIKADQKIQKISIYGNSYYDFILSELAQAENNQPRSLEYLILAQTKDPESLFLKKVLARRFILIKNVDKADKLINEVLKKEPNDTEALGLLGGLMAITNKPAEKIKDVYKKIITIEPDNGKAAIALAFLLEKLGKNDELIDIFEKAVKKTDDNYYLYFYLGEAYLIKKDYLNARQNLNKAVIKKPNQIEPKLSLIESIKNLKKNKKNKKKIVDLFYEIIELKPEDPTPLVELSYFYYLNGDIEKSDETFKPVSEEWNLDKKRISSLIFRICNEKQFKKAKFLASKLFQTTGDDTGLMVLAEGYSEEGLKDEALIIYSDIDQKSEYFTRASASSAYILADKGDFNKAIKILERSLNVYPKDTILLITLGNIYEEIKDYKKALELYEKGVKEDSELKWSFYYRLGVVSDKAGNKDDTISYMKKSLKIKPDNPDSLNYLGYTYADLGINLEEAKEMIIKALSIKKNDGYITDSLGWVYFKLGEIEEAIKWLNKAYELVKDDPIILEHLGDVYKTTGDNKKADSFYKKALEMDPENKELKNKISEFK